ncbi:sensor histidine kinase [Pararhodonellum marinum]|uniref:sensor histidine kinase n=1 Tax=Pararhodonellum marinum TaxID=2755358 RepID=UPI0018905CB2|nr:histidine kinase dimerization/phosphoacceptor domain -containing protein [Pararhodonellum marinum]
MELLWEAAETSLDEDVSKTKSYTSRLMAFEEVQHDSSLLMKALRYQATAERWLGNYVQSIKEFGICYQYYKNQSDTVNLAIVNSYLGAMNVFMGYNEEAQKYLLERYELLKPRDMPSELASAVNGLAIFYANMGQNEKAYERYLEALALYESADDTLGRASIHANLGLLLMEEGNLEEAEHHLKIQGRLDSLVNDQRGLGFHFDFMGSLKNMQGKKEEALQYHLTGLQIRSALPSIYNVSESRAGLAQILYDLERYDDAIDQAEKILETRFETQSLSHQERAYGVLAESHEAKGNYSQALAYYKDYKLISDSIYNRDLAEILAEKDAKFELVEQKAKISLLDTENQASKLIIGQKNKTLIVVVSAMVLFTLLSLILFMLLKKYLRQKKDLAKALGEKDILLGEIHHRVKNNLQLISSLLTLQGKSINDEMAINAINEGRNRVRSMALIHQDLYQRDNITGLKVKDYLIKLCRELFDTYNIHNDQVKLHLDIEELNLDIDTLIPLGLIMNELITNSLKYAFPEKKDGDLYITLKEKAGLLKLQIKDNGVGYDPDNVREASFGQRMVKSLIEQLDGAWKVVHEHGTEVLMEFKDYKITPV